VAFVRAPKLPLADVRELIRERIREFFAN